MTDELIQSDGWEPLHEGGKEASLNGIEVPEEGAAKFPSQMIQDSQGHCTKEQRPSPCRKILEKSNPDKSRPAIHANREVVSNELLQEDGWETLHQGAEEAFLNGIEVREEDAAKFPSEMIQDSEEDCAEDQRQSLYQKIMEMSVADKFRLAIHANREVRNLLIHDPKRMISLAVLKNRRINETEILRYAQRKDLSEDVVSAIAKDPKWKKSYPMKLALVTNPKTPLSLSINMLPHLQDRDLKALSRDKDVAPPLKIKAQEFLRQRNNTR
jgi:hypothetical protein